MATGAKTDLGTGEADATGHRLTSLLLICLLVAIATAIGVSQFGATPMIEPDSASYIDASGIRALGYPFFLAFLRWLGIPLEGVPWVQLALHLAALPVLFGAVLRASGNRWIAAGVVVFCYANPEVAKYHAKILSESVFLTVAVLYIAALLSFLTAPSGRAMATVSFWAGLGIAIKPVGWAFVVLLGLVFLSQIVRQRGRTAFAVAFFVPLIGVMAVESVSSKLVHGPKRASLAPLHVFGKAGMVDAHIPAKFLSEGPNAALHRALEQDAAAIRRLVDRAPGANVARFLTVNYEVFLQYQFARTERQAIAVKGDLGAAMLATGFERLRHGWPGYLGLAAQHYLGLWLLYDASHPSHFKLVNAFIAKEKPLPFEAAVPAIAAGATSAGVIALIARPAVAAGGVATVILACIGLAGLVRPDAIPLIWRQAGLLALGLQGYCLLVALTGVGIPRYLLGVWPFLVVALGLGVAGTWQGWRNRKVPNSRFHPST